MKLRHKSLFLLIFYFSVFLSSFSFSQNIPYDGKGRIYGLLRDRETNSLIEFATISVWTFDSTLIGSTLSDESGKFNLLVPLQKPCFLKVSLLGYKAFQSGSIDLNKNKPEKDFGEIKLDPMNIKLREVNIEGTQIRVSQSGDTTQYNAAAFKTAPDAEAADLVKKLPGITNENGVLKVNGEEIKKILVDGKPFFGDDPNMALKNLPADLIDKIKVFDKLSDQSQVSGFDDGQSVKTLNIITKPGRNNGKFGKLYSGYGTEKTYSSGGNMNFFNGDRRISIIGLFNNINQQNFSQQDILGALGSPTSGKAGGGMGGSGRILGMGAPGGNDANNFLVAQQVGVTTTNASGLNFSDVWMKKLKINGSYFFNQFENENKNFIYRKYVNPAFSFYNEENVSNAKNFNHRINLRLEYNIDSSNTLFLIPKINFQTNKTFYDLKALSPKLISNSHSNASLTGDNWGMNLIYNLKFKKTGRTLSVNFNHEQNDKISNSQLLSLNSDYFSGSDSLNQKTDLNTNTKNIAAGIIYTEPLDTNFSMMFSFSPSFLQGNNEKLTDSYDYLNNELLGRDSALSSIYKSVYTVNKLGLGIRMKKNNISFMAFGAYQYSILQGNNSFPPSFPLFKKSFHDVLPMSMFNYKWPAGTNLRIIYRVNTTPPSIGQLQGVLNNSNPLLLTIGNPDLRPDHSHTLVIRYGMSNHEKANGIFLFAFLNYTFDYMGNKSIIPTKDSVFEHITILKGSQLNRPVNLGEYFNTRFFLTYSLPFPIIKSNLNLTSGFVFNQIPAMINEKINISRNYNLSEGVSLSSNISENFDFNLSYLGSYSIAINSLQAGIHQNYFNHSLSLNLNKIFFERWIFNTSLNQSYFTGLSTNFNTSFTLLNLALAYKFFKAKNIETRISVFDALNQNNNISRNFTETYTEDAKSNVLGRYYMFTLSYFLKDFKK